MIVSDVGVETTTINELSKRTTKSIKAVTAKPTLQLLMYDRGIQPGVMSHVSAADFVIKAF